MCPHWAITCMGARVSETPVVIHAADRLHNGVLLGVLWAAGNVLGFLLLPARVLPQLQVRTPCGQAADLHRAVHLLLCHQHDKVCSAKFEQVSTRRLASNLPQLQHGQQRSTATWPCA